MTTEDKISKIIGVEEGLLRYRMDVFDYLGHVEQIESTFNVHFEDKEIANFETLSTEDFVNYYSSLVTKILTDKKCNLAERIELARKEYSAWLDGEIKKRPRGFASSMCEALEITDSMLHLYRNGKRYPNSDTQKKINSYLNSK